MIKPYDGTNPTIHPSSFCASTALILGRVTLLAGSSVWPGCVLRADVDSILIGQDTNIQDGALIHPNHAQPVVIGAGVTVGHGAVLHGCRIGDHCLIGMGAIVLDGAVIGAECIIGAGAVVTEKTVIKDRSMVVGTPGRMIRTVSDEEIQRIRRNAAEYKELAAIHAKADL